MRVHHLKCASFHPPGGTLVCHCLLVETQAGLVLVDSGLGREDIRHPRPRLAVMTLAMLRPTLVDEDCASVQVERLGHKLADVRHIVLTHLDCDHAGGLEDFPNALVHVHRTELDAALNATSCAERARYRPAQWTWLGERWRPHRRGSSTWSGLPVLEQGDLPAGLEMVELPGHTWGHCGVTVDHGSHVLLYAGDAYFHRSEVRSPGLGVPLTLRLTELFDRVDASAWRESRAALRAILVQDRHVAVFCAHDPIELREMQEAEATPTTVAGGRTAA